METMDRINWSKTLQELKQFVYRKVNDLALAEDIVQDVILKVHFKLGQLKDKEKLAGWIYQITKNAITDHFRSKSKQIEFSDLNWESEAHGLNDCVASCLSEMMETLPQKYRQALELTEIQNLSQTNLAEKLNISYSGAKSRVQRARQMLKEKMDQSYLIKTDSYGNVLVCESRVPCNCTSIYGEVYC